MLLDNIPLIDRFNRPSVGGKVAIRTLFINNGEFIDPYDVSACTIFTKLANASPASIVDGTDGLIKSDATSVVLMNFGVSGGLYTTDPHDGTLGRVTSQRMAPPYSDNNGYPLWNKGYEPGTQASGIFRVGLGDYVAVLDGSLALSGGYFIRTGGIGADYQVGITVANGASSVQDYIDVWTVKLYQDSEYQLFINNFSLYNDTFTTITEPLLLTTRNRLINKKLRYGEKVDMKITTDITIQNSTLPEETKNILRDYQISGAQVQIQRVNQDSVNQPAWSSVVDYATDGTLNSTITTDNTIIYTFDTLSKGAVAGTYFIVAKYSYLTQNFVSPPFYFTIT